MQVEKETEFIGTHCTETCLRDGHTEFCSLGPHCTEMCLKEGHSDDCWMGIEPSGKNERGYTMDILKRSAKFASTKYE